MATNPFGGWLSNNSDALLAASAGLLGGRTAADQVSGGLQGYAGVQSANKQKNKTLEFLKGVNPDLAAAVEAGALSPLDAYKTHVESQKPQKPIEVNGRLVDPNTYKVIADFSDKPAGAQPSFQVLPSGEYGYADPSTRQFTPLGTAQKPEDLAKIKEASFKNEQEAIKTYRQEDNVKMYNTVRDSYERVKTGASLKNAQGDLGVVYGYMKLLDPGSVVREGEFATAQNSGGVDDTVINTYNKLLSGERLNDEQRAAFTQAAEGLYKEAASNLDDTNKRYKGMADEYGLPSDRILVQPETYDTAGGGGRTPRRTSRGTVWSR